jgi:hypothetical protein
MKNASTIIPLSIIVGLIPVISGCSDPCLKYSREYPQKWTELKQIYNSIDMNNLSEGERRELEQYGQMILTQLKDSDEYVNFMKCLTRNKNYKISEKDFIFICRTPKEELEKGNFGVIFQQNR